MAEKRDKIVIIGAGIGGLTAAVYAGKMGYEAEVYEQHTLVGGECTGWDREGYHIDNCVHWLMGSKPDTALNTLWNTVGAIGPDIPMYRNAAMYASELNGDTLTLWSDAARTEQEMLALSPEDVVEIRTLIKACRKAQKLTIPAEVPGELMTAGDGFKLMLSMGGAMQVFKQYEGMNVEDLMQRFKHPLIRCLISDFTTPEGLASSFAAAYGNFISGDGGIPAGGSRALAQRMRERAEQYGCKFFCGRPVDKILVENGHATGVRLSDGTVTPCDYVIPACDASVTFGKLLPESYMPALLRDMFQDRAAYPVYNTFQTALAVDSAEDALGVERMWDCPELAFTPGMRGRLTVKCYAYEPGFAPEGKQILQTLQGGSEDVYTFWTELHKDPEAYRAKKQELAALTLRAVERRLPAYKGKLRVLDAWTPMTYARYCSAYKGYYESFTVSKNGVKSPYPPAYIEGVDNAVLAGQWISPPGGLPGAAITGKFAVQRIAKLAGRDHRV